MNSSLSILADENIPALEPLFGPLGQLRRLPGRTLSADDVADADILLVRSVTRVGPDLLAGSSVRFVGTATIGTDHLDIPWLEEAGIHWCNAPGCNADSVVDHVLSALWHLAAERGRDPLDFCVGVVGAGNVGGRLLRRLEALGMRTLVCDPPRAEQEGEAGFVSLEQVLQEADLVALHTPLTDSGDHATWHLLQEDNLPLLKPGAILLNAGRGAVIDNGALLRLMERRDDLTLVLDVWEEEPDLDPQLARHCALATPHIAGYSLDGKIRGTWMLYQALCRWLEIDTALTLEEVLPPPAISRIVAGGVLDPLDPMRLIHDPYRDDRALRRTLGLPPTQKALAFDRLRREYPIRREFSSLELAGIEDPEQRRLFAALGFRLAMA